MLDFDILKSKGTTEERLREIFTRTRPANMLELPEDAQKKIERDIKTRESFESKIRNVSYDQIEYNLKNCSAFSAVDLAFDCLPIAKEIGPLMLLAQGKINHKQCIQTLKTLENWEQYVAKNPKTQEDEIQIPAFVEVNINLVHSLITRRASAQTTKYNSFYPFLKADSKLTSQVGKLRADVLSQAWETIVDEFDYRGHQEQVERDALLYGQVADFVTEDWIRLNQLRKNPNSLTGEESEDYPCKEGLDWFCCHPSHLLWDRSQPLSAIRKDLGLEYIGYWDIQKYGTILHNPSFFNRNDITYNDSFLNLFTSYGNYFSQYYCTINTGSLETRWANSDDNSRINGGLKYASDTNDAPVLLTVFFMKVNPVDWDMGTYPYPIWMRFVAAGTGTIVSAKIMPSSPAAYCGINQRDSRMWGSSFAMQIMPFQDMLTNLTSQLMAEMSARRVKIFALNTDGVEAEDQKKIDARLTAANWFVNPIVLKYSGDKKATIGMEKAFTKPVELCQPNNNPGDVTAIVQAMIQTVALAERINIVSSNEVGQPIVRSNGGITATESGNIESSTNVMSIFVADSFDAYRADVKRILYESMIAKGSPNIRVPVLNRYPVSVIRKAGFEVFDEDGDGIPDGAMLKNATVIGTKKALVYEYVFNTRDGSKRVVNSQTATTLIQMLPIFQNEVALQALGKQGYFNILNEIGRNSGAGVDFNLEVKPGEESMDLPSERAADQLADHVKQLMGIVEKNTSDIQALQQQLVQFMQKLNGKAMQQPQLTPTR